MLNTGDFMKHAEARQRLLDIAARADPEEGILHGLEDAKRGKVRPAREFFADFEAKPTCEDRFERKRAWSAYLNNVIATLESVQYSRPYLPEQI